MVGQEREVYVGFKTLEELDGLVSDLVISALDRDLLKEDVDELLRTGLIGITQDGGQLEALGTDGDANDCKDMRAVKKSGCFGKAHPCELLKQFVEEVGDAGTFEPREDATETKTVQNKRQSSCAFAVFFPPTLEWFEFGFCEQLGERSLRQTA